MTSAWEIDAIRDLGGQNFIDGFPDPADTPATTHWTASEGNPLSDTQLQSGSLEGPITTAAVATFSLAADASLIVVRDELGWRFERWESRAGATLPPPVLADEHRFTTPDRAAAFFRALWPPRATR